MQNPFANETETREGPLGVPSVSVHGDEMRVDPAQDHEFQDEGPRTYKVPKTKWW